MFAVQYISGKPQFFSQSELKAGKHKWIPIHMVKSSQICDSYEEALRWVELLKEKISLLCHQINLLHYGSKKILNPMS